MVFPLYVSSWCRMPAIATALASVSNTKRPSSFGAAKVVASANAFSPSRMPLDASLSSRSVGSS